VHLDDRDDELVRVAPLPGRVGRFTDLIVPGSEPETFAALRAAETIGRPLGSDAFLARLERRLGRRVRPRKPGRKPRTDADETRPHRGATRVAAAGKQLR